MRFVWKVLVPVGLLWILLVAAIRTATLEVDDRRTLLLGVGAVFAVVLAVFYLIPAGKTDGELTGEQERTGPGTDVTPLAQGGFPTPPMDLVVPPTPRSLQKAAVSSAPAQDAAAPTSTPDREA